MVQELHAENPRENDVDWDTRTEFYFDLVMEGIPLPDKLHDLHKAEFTFHGDMTSAITRNKFLWNSYVLAVDVQDGRTPRERLNEYFSKSGV